ncbi:MAG TPA: hypothetical protein VIE42_03585 [Steroidobacteraceae bacterium]|jgi:hypothetical protein
MASKAVAYVLVALVLTARCESALGYRPFDGTDADVAASGDFELELGPLGRLREGTKRIDIAPAVVANFGLQGDRELVIQGQRETALDRDPGQPRSSIVDNGVFIKQVLRKGVLQDESGPSIATECGLLLPSINGAKGTGFSVAGIVSQRVDAGTVHLNAALAQTREHQPDLFLGAIVEGPHAWVVRPVAEVFTEQASGSARIKSALVGAIWRVRNELSFDAGIRRAHEGTEAVHELRVGLTWTFR